MPGDRSDVTRFQVLGEVSVGGSEAAAVVQAKLACN
jgi:hypothetical protein